MLANKTAGYRVQHGKAREGQIAMALRVQHGLDLRGVTENEDRHAKVDRWLMRDGQKLGLQIKFRESGQDVLFEVFDRWCGHDDVRNRLGRDMQGRAELYACLIGGRVLVVPCSVARGVIIEMLAIAESGWSIYTEAALTLRYRSCGHCLELKATIDPCDGRRKMMAYIPAGWFVAQGQLETYAVSLPTWRHG